MIATKNKITRHPPGKGFLSQSLYNESGFAMVTALLLMTVMIALIPAAIRLTTGEIDRTSNFKDNREAFFVAEAGLEHAKFLTEETSLRAALAGPDDLVTATPSDSENDDNGTFGLGAPVALPVDDGNLYDTAVLNGTTYYIRAFDNDDGDGDLTTDKDNMVFLSAVGIVDGTTTRVEALVFNPPGIPIGAVTTNGDLTISGNSTVTGACGNVHANGDLTLSGASGTVNGNATSTGTTDPGTATVTGVALSSQAEIIVPFLDVTEFKPYADYIFKADGNVYDDHDPAAGPIGSGSGPGWNGWKYQIGPQKWVNNSGNDALDAFIYIEGNVSMNNGTAGTPGNKWELTLVATGYVDVSGNDNIVNKRNPSHPVDIQNLYFIGGTDVKFNGNSGQTVQGVFYAIEQIDVSGNADMTGAIMAYNIANVENLVNGSNTISGNPTITYDCGLTTPTTTVVIDVVAWNEV